MIAELALYIVFGVTAVVTGVAVIVVKNPVHSAMFLVLNFFCIGVLFLVLNAPFIAVLQVLVYAGAIMVLFVFVIMLLNATGAIENVRDHLQYNKVVAAVLVVGLLIEGGLIISTGLFSTPAATTKPLTGLPAMTFGTPEEIGRVFFTTYLLPFEVTSVLLLIAMVGALAIAKRRLM